jgi:23S rRNA (guanosine2251-2'-O)-methyltransferase
LGAHGLFIAKDRAVPVTGAVAKASAGAIEHLAVAQVGSMTAFVHDARAGGARPAFGAEPERGEDYRAVAWRPDAILVMGAEGAGLRPAVAAVCDGLVRIPMAGRVASLNISVAAALLLFETFRTTK